MDELYLEARRDKNNIRTTLETYIVLSLYLYLKKSDVIKINFVEGSRKDLAFEIKLDNLFDYNYYEIDDKNYPENAKKCQMPTYYSSPNIISGLCGVSRKITRKYIESNECSRNYLGFKMNTLLAPSEFSMWTKYCEVDIVNCLYKIFNIDMNCTDFFTVPEEILKFESHLSQPLKQHNLYKLINNVNNLKISSHVDYLQLKDDKKFDVHKNHKFAEGFEVTLADLILYSCYIIILHKMNLKAHLPLIYLWFQRVKESETNFEEICLKLIKNTDCLKKIKVREIKLEKIENFSLYKSDSKKLNFNSTKVLTNQDDIHACMEKISKIGFDISSKPCENGEKLDWSSIPLLAKPLGGNLPSDRIERKNHQLQNMACEVIKIAKHGDIIVDFCSGTGHLGILLAFLLPRCQIYLLENKEESILRAMHRVKELGLENITFIQSNLDYFTGNFDIGVSLHACGIATDIVLQKCWDASAHFVCCPCCYGKICEIDHISYPRSEVFRKAFRKWEYFLIAHAADQSHDIDNLKTNVQKSNQGYYCMDIIDTDRKLRAEELGYKVVLRRLNPENCTPKNRLIVGIK